MSSIPDRVPPLDLRPELEELWTLLSEAALRVLRSGQYVLGPEVEAFEREAAEFLGVRHAVGLNSGTDALLIGLRCIGVEAGDEVITTPFSFFATAEAISMVGAVPVFADIESSSFNIDPAAVEAAVTDRTVAVLPVHLFGRPVDMDAIGRISNRHGLQILEDCAQSIGARLGDSATGSIGRAGAFSFYPTKNLGGIGDGGLLTTNDDRIFEVARMLRNHGERSRYNNEMLGYNSRLDAMQAALLRVKLDRLESANRARRRAAEVYGALMEGIEGVSSPEVTEGHVFHQYTVRVHEGRRDAVRAAMDASGIGTMVYYPIPIHRLPVYAACYGGVQLPVAEAAAGEVLSLPIWPGIEESTQRRVIDALSRALDLD